MHIIFFHIQKGMHLFSKMKDIFKCVWDDTSHTMQYILLSWVVGAMTALNLWTLFEGLEQDQDQE